MKELSIEEKASRYDDLLVRLQEAKVDNDVCDDRYCCVIDVIVPKLKESEDEKIRKELIRAFKSLNTIKVWNGIERTDILAWLEKQDEQKPADKVEPKFHKGDIIKPKDGGHEPWQIMQVDISDKKYRFKDGYVIHFSQEDDYELVEQKNTWSEEDEDYINDLIRYFSQNEKLKNTKEDIVIWLKSLKQQKHWKPSDAQMDSITCAVRKMKESACYDSELVSLHQDLKNLKG